MRRDAIITAAFVLFLILAVAFFHSPRPITTNAVVTRVIDGDTIVVEGGDRVRLLDIDTAERGESCYSEAKTRLEELIDGKEVALVSRGEDVDRYGRLLRYVFVDDELVNLVLVREGLANLYVTNKNTEYYPLLVEAEQAAKSENGCVWK